MTKSHKIIDAWRGVPALVLFALLACLALAAQAQNPRGMPGALPVDGVLTEDGIKISWVDAKPKFAGSVEVSRRPLGAEGSDSWTIVAPSLGPVQAYLDRDTVPGTAWEYRVRRMGRTVVDQGYWTGGRDVAMPDQRGLAVLVVEDALSTDLAPDLARFRDDLTGDGWRVTQIGSPADRNLPAALRLISALELKNDIREARKRHPDGELAVILLGHIPMVYSGRVAPDGHEHIPHATDLFYVDLDGRWQSTGEGVLIHAEIPNGQIEGSIGRIDFSNMLAPDRTTELDWLRAYLQRNHDWRHGRTDVPRRAYAGSVGHLFVERSGVSNIVGKDAVTEGGHADAGQDGRWLFGVDFGPWKSDDYFTDFAARPVFAINFGSHKQKIGRPRNPMNALMTPPNEALAVAWGARPAWRLHGMAMGETIGAAQVRTVNNGPSTPGHLDTVDYLPTGGYPFVHPIWGNLLGDPTLHAIPTLPPSDVKVTPVEGEVQISWTPSPLPDASYRIYRLDTEDRASLVTESDSTSVTLTESENSAARYMVRAVAPQTLPSGSMLILSQGALSAKVTTTPAE